MFETGVEVGFVRLGMESEAKLRNFTHL